MSQHRHLSAEKRAAIKLAERQRVEAERVNEFETGGGIV
jgi:hypothetical protein